MPLQSSGQISMSEVFSEQNSGFLPGLNGNVSLTTMSQNYNTDPCNTAAVDGVAPHSLEEFYNYDHNCGGSGGSCLDVEITAGYGDPGEACISGPRATCFAHKATSTSLVIGDTVYDDLACGSVFPGGNMWYYDCTNGSRVIQINDFGSITGESACGGKSDIRLKHNIERIGTSSSGIPIYTFEYLDDDKHIHEGTMAQDLIEMGREDLVIMDRDGYYRVLYHLTDVKMVKRPK